MPSPACGSAGRGHEGTRGSSSTDSSARSGVRRHRCSRAPGALPQAVSSQRLSAFSLQTRRSSLRLSTERRPNETWVSESVFCLSPQERSSCGRSTSTVSGVELVTIGWILMAVGLAGALLSLIFWSSWGGFGGPADGRRRTWFARTTKPDANSVLSRAPLRRGSSSLRDRRRQLTADDRDGLEVLVREVLEHDAFVAERLGLAQPFHDLVDRADRPVLARSARALPRRCVRSGRRCAAPIRVARGRRGRRRTAPSASSGASADLCRRARTLRRGLAFAHVPRRCWRRRCCTRPRSERPGRRFRAWRCRRRGWGGQGDGGPARRARR